MDIYRYIPSFTLLPIALGKVPLGFPSPAEGFEDKSLSLDDLLIQHPISTFFVKMTGDSMIDAHIADGDIAIIDKSINPKHNDIVLAHVEGLEFTIKRLIKRSGKVYLYPANKKYQPMEMTEFIQVRIFGVVVGTVRKYA